MREISENNLRWFAARLSIAVEDTKRFGGMSVHELKQALRDVPGIESLTMGLAPNGSALVTIAGRTVEVSPTASNAEIALAFREPAMSTPNVTVQTATPLPAPVTFTTPTVAPQTGTNAPVASTTRTTSMSTPAAPGSFAAGIRAMMDEAVAGVEKAKADGLATVGNAVGKLKDAATATTRVAANMAQSAEDQAADILKELGQISNDLGGTSA